MMEKIDNLVPGWLFEWLCWGLVAACILGSKPDFIPVFLVGATVICVIRMIEKDRRERDE